MGWVIIFSCFVCLLSTSSSEWHEFCFYFPAIYLSLTDTLLPGLRGVLAVLKNKWRTVFRWPSVMNPFCIDEIPAVVKTISESPQTGAKWWGRPVDTSVFGPSSELCWAPCLDDWLTSGDASLITSAGRRENERHRWWWQTLAFLVSCEQQDEHFLFIATSRSRN